MYIIRRTTIEIDQALLSRAKAALGSRTTRATVEEALRRVADQASDDAVSSARAQTDYLHRLESLADLEILRTDEMWR